MKIAVSVIVVIFISKIILDLVGDGPSGDKKTSSKAGHDKYIRVRDEKPSKRG